MKEEVKQVLDEFVKECSEKLELEGIIQFGSSTYDENAHDIDLIFVSKNYIRFTKEILLLIQVIKKFEKNYPKVVFDFAGVSSRKRKAKYSITVVFLQRGLLETKYNPSDLFFFKNLSLDKNKKVLFGKDPFPRMKITLTKWHLFEMLSVDLTKALRNSLDDSEYRNDALYFLFKTYLRGMLINEGHFEKKDLLVKFKEKFGENVILPENSKKIIKGKIEDKDFENILKFCESCLIYLAAYDKAPKIK